MPGQCREFLLLEVGLRKALYNATETGRFLCQSLFVKGLQPEI